MYVPGEIGDVSYRKDRFMFMLACVFTEMK